MLNSNDFESLEIKLDGKDDISMLLGTHDKHVKFLEENTETTINTRGEMIQIIGPKGRGKISRRYHSHLADFDRSRD